MKNTLGENVRLTLWGESHGKYIGAVLDGLCPGIEVNTDYIKEQLSKRRPKGKNETPRVEEDNFIIASGVFNGFTTGEPLSVIIENNNIKSKDYDKMKDVFRPSHADYTSYIKSKGFYDYRGGGHFSGRITAAIVCACSILLYALEKKNIYIGTHIKKCKDVIDRDFGDSKKEILELRNKRFPVLNDIEDDINTVIDNARLNKDSVGGILQTCINGLPAGLGEPWFSSVEGKLALAMFSIGGVKGIDFGLGFGFANSSAKNCNDYFVFDENKNIKTKTNNNGGINGGITNSMDVIFNLAVKPTPSIASVQESVNIKTLENVNLEIDGRHDPAIIRRMAVVVECLSALVVCDMLALRYGNNFLDYEV